MRSRTKEMFWKSIFLKVESCRMTFYENYEMMIGLGFMEIMAHMQNTLKWKHLRELLEILLWFCEDKKKNKTSKTIDSDFKAGSLWLDEQWDLKIW